jgi:hypothetical protein
MRATPSRDCKKDMKDEHWSSEKTCPLHVLPEASKAIVLNLSRKAPSEP